MSIALTDTQYERFRDLLHNRSGLFYPEHKRIDLAHRLAMLLSDSDYTDLDVLYADAVKGGAAWDLLVNNLTIGETYFFRNTPQFDALRYHILPELIARRAELPPVLRSLRIWSAGCSTGEEPYSLAMLLRDVLPDVEQWYVSLLATDINTVSLERAREALYKEWSFRETAATQRGKFFQQEGKAWRVRSEIRSMVTFARLNLVETSYPSITNGTSALDLIVCRNVTIYFDELTTRQIIDRMFHALAPGGWLIVGHSEPQASVYHQFETHNFPNTVVYRKAPTAPLFATPGAQPASPPPPLFVAQPTPTSPVVAPRFERFSGPPPAAPIAPAPITPARAAASPRTKRWNAFKSALEQGDADEAEALLDGLMDEAPDDVQALCAHARADLARGNTERAHQAVGHALKYDPLCVEAYFVLAQLHEHQGEYEQAITAYRRAVFLDATCVPGIVGMAGGWKAIGRVDLAQRYYQHALKQLAQMPPNAKVAMADGATASELGAVLTAQLEQTSIT